jgi:hypothetical protein
MATRRARTATLDAPTTFPPENDPSVVPAPPEIPLAPDRTQTPKRQVSLPALPALEDYFIKNTMSVHFEFQSHAEGIRDLYLGPHEEKRLPDPEFWLRHRRFRDHVEPREHYDTGEMIPPPVELFQSARSIKAEKPVPEKLRVDEKYLGNVQTICYGALDEARALIFMQPMTGRDGDRVDVKYLVKTWGQVLARALWRLRDDKRIGKEVDTARIQDLQVRLRSLEDMARENRITGVAFDDEA